MRTLKRATFAAAVTGVLSFAILARGHAPQDQYESFGTQAVFIDDPHTHLTWQRIVDQTPTDQKTAAGHCATSGQRLPTYRELLTLVDEDPHDEWDPESGMGTARYIDPDAFPGTPAGPFWTMSPGTATSTFKVVDFKDGTTTNEGFFAYYRCVSDDP